MKKILVVFLLFVLAGTSIFAEAFFSGGVTLGQTTQQNGYDDSKLAMPLFGAKLSYESYGRLLGYFVDGDFALIRRMEQTVNGTTIEIPSEALNKAFHFNITGGISVKFQPIQSLYLTAGLGVGVTNLTRHYAQNKLLPEVTPLEENIFALGIGYNLAAKFMISDKWFITTGLNSNHDIPLIVSTNKDEEIPEDNTRFSSFRPFFSIGVCL